MARASKKKSNVISLDFEGVEVSKLVPEGDHLLTAVEVTKEEGNEYPYLSWVLETADGGKIYENNSLSPRALWRLRALLEAAGVEVPDGPMDLDLDTIIDDMSPFMGTIEHEDYEGRPKAKMVDCYPSEEEEEEPVKKGKSTGKKSSAKKEEPEEEDDFDSDEIMEMSADELEEFIDDQDLDVDLEDYRKLKDKRQAVKDAYDDKGGDDDGDDDGDKVSEDEVNEMGTKELQALIDKHELDVELTGSTKTKRRAVIKALKEEDLLKD